MILFLTSSPYVYQHSPATLTEANGFLLRLRSKLPPHPKTLFVASSPAEHDRTDFYCGDMAGAFARAGISMPGWQILDDLTADRARELVAWSDFIILMGGHVPTQNEFFHRIGLKRLLQGYPGVVMGISAGTMNSADLVYAQPELEGEAADSGYVRFLKGLGLTQANILPHYQMVKDSWLDGMRLYEDITFGDSYGQEFLVLPDGSYLMAYDGEELLFGEAWLIRNGRIEKISEEGQSMPYLRSENG